MRWGGGHLLSIAGLAALCAWLGLALHDQLRGGNAVDAGWTASVAGKRVPRVGAEPNQAFSIAPLSELDAIVERPLFFEGRRLPVEDPVAPVAPAVDTKSPSNFVLTGIVISPDEKMALVREPNGKDVLSVTVGQNIGAWKLEEILPDKIVLRWGDRVEEVKIEDQKPPPAARRPARPRTRAPSAGRARAQPRPPNRAALRSKRTSEGAAR